jgi:L-serine dehydratase
MEVDMLRVSKVEIVIDYLTKQLLQPLTPGETFDLASQLDVKVSEMVVGEAACYQKMTPGAVLSKIKSAFKHNLEAVEFGISKSGRSFLLGQVGYELYTHGLISEDPFLDRAVSLTLAAQIGNHMIGLSPCAGTGDACVYTGLVAALLEQYNEAEIWPAVAVMLKLGTFFRAGKCTTGCNMEGLGAGATGTAALLVELAGGGPEEIKRAFSLALSPTIGVPCTPRVMVPGLCATHIGGAIMIGQLAAQLALKTSLPVTVPADVMLAMAAKAHRVSAQQIVPEVISYMEGYFKSDVRVDNYIDSDVRAQIYSRDQKIAQKARNEIKAIAATVNPITEPFGAVVVGGSSQAVGSPTNTARVAHAMIKGKITGIKIELYPELFARRAINIPGILMGAIYGAGTDDIQRYQQVMDDVLELGIKIIVIEAEEPQLQRITIETTVGHVMVDARNRGGGRIALIDAVPSKQEALDAAKKLGIVVVA